MDNDFHLNYLLYDLVLVSTLDLGLESISGVSCAVCHFCRYLTGYQNIFTGGYKKTGESKGIIATRVRIFKMKECVW